MNNKKFGRLFILIGVLLFFLMIFLEIFPFLQFHTTSGHLIPVLTFSSIILCSGGISIYYLNASDEKRRKVVRVLSYCCGTLFLFGIISKLLHYPGASIEILVSLVFFSFSALPLIIKNRYEKRKDLLSQKLIFMSILDLISSILLVYALISRLFHWSNAQFPFILGCSGLLISLLNWNRSFRKEVVLRKAAESQLKTAFVQLEEKNKEILDSITYAQRIQRALLASESLLKRNLNESFFLFQPKDIVSGDFYWASNAHGKFYLIVADSTGHGVPGAFMSLLNISYLNEAINEKGLKKTNEILQHVRSSLIQHLNLEGSKDGGNDGMDCILLCFDFANLHLEFSCANNPLLIVRDGKWIEFEADKIPVGKSVKNDLPFRLQSTELKSGDLIYAFTDGLADQFGGPKGKKLKYKQLCQHLLEHHHLSTTEQKEQLTQLFKNWKGNLEQVDDVLIAGIKIT
jgi:serine phosphatase RsbU (regulator of sigma subunit)